MNGDPRYTEPNRRAYPPVTRAAILPFYKRLIAAFGKLADMPVGVAEDRRAGGRGDYVSRRSRARTCWASTKPTDGHHKGWGRMIHDASHRVFEVRHPHARPHDGGHATLEREMVEYVERKGWVAKLELAKLPTPKPDKFAKLARAEAALERWRTKALRAHNAIKKLDRTIKRLNRRPTCPTI
jgi:hypothetical protein